MNIIALQSGSKGNCIYLESGGTRLLFDAGISGLCAQNRLSAYGIDIRTVDALFITHDHHDHVDCAGVLHRKFKIPVWMTKKTHAATQRKIGRVSNVQHFAADTRFRFQSVTIEAIATPHDAVDGVCFVVDDGHLRFGICTDLGHVFNGLPDLVESLDGVLLESNYDPDMLEYGIYPPGLKDRVRGQRGHLSNFEAARLIDQHGKKLQSVMLGHISDENNTEPLVMKTLRQIAGEQCPCELAHRHTYSNCLEIH